MAQVWGAVLYFLGLCFSVAYISFELREEIGSLTGHDLKGGPTAAFGVGASARPHPPRDSPTCTHLCDLVTVAEAIISGPRARVVITGWNGAFAMTLACLANGINYDQLSTTEPSTSAAGF